MEFVNSSLPFFWDSPVNLITVIKKTAEKKSDITYTWQLQDGSDDIVKSGQFVGTHKKPHTLYLGYLRPHQVYRLSTIITDDNYVSIRLPIAYFTVKDRDEFHTQILIGVIVIIAGIVIGLISKGCGL